MYWISSSPKRDYIRKLPISPPHRIPIHPVEDPVSTEKGLCGQTPDITSSPCPYSEQRSCKGSRVDRKGTLYTNSLSRIFAVSLCTTTILLMDPEFTEQVLYSQTCTGYRAHRKGTIYTNSRYHLLTVSLFNLCLTQARWRGWPQAVG